MTPKTPATRVVPATPKAPAATARLDRVIDALIAAKKSDADILDGITLVVLGRLPTDAEKKLTLGLISKAADRKAAWLEVAKALAATGEGKERSDATGSGDVIELKGVLELKDAIDLTVTRRSSSSRAPWRAPATSFASASTPRGRSPELKPRTNPEVKPLPPAKK